MKAILSLLMKLLLLFYQIRYPRESNRHSFGFIINLFIIHRDINIEVGGTSIIDISVNNGQNGPIFHKETNRHTRDK